ncbi:Asp23/Gls24 family envelope stress response protein [Clostridium celatum]|uniref:Alkaline shock protein 23 domain protein n=1 Tax=Clostridium celatum DSM 1785 TaxID=545697 RepID=L1QHC8_9CLOT|nr:Asp23/Gls24 family envelope stress response protein [Clostridium celatum]EKY26997.1 alkaline shock protein 23 domain protein [Clostridium celatum DSM 1785]MCE9654744.1 Asp23/Gls24 family envelope stress response protein [Clostridium celatum]MDU3723097.1 Asp23/Gls24 family envelope stress response protein [Clostridium celatum]MDU6295817.1 Asp23/Gls24 family envelope stress response protein [Clostridium celatum]MDY3359298.1 Asp23/Gls24 family envelope stress response protein [Clostridium cela
MENNVGEKALGIVKISDEVVSIIAGIAADEIQGIVGIPHGVSNNISQILKGKKTTNNKSVKVTLEEDKAVIELNVAVEYGIKIPEVVSEVQENVRKTVEAMTGLNVDTVNVNVQNIYVKKQEQEAVKEV